MGQHSEATVIDYEWANREHPLVLVDGIWYSWEEGDAQSFIGMPHRGIEREIDTKRIEAIEIKYADKWDGVSF